MQQKLMNIPANDAYWHGLFVVCIFPILRRAVFTSGIVERKLCWIAAFHGPASFTEDTDLDGMEEAYLQNGILQAV